MAYMRNFISFGCEADGFGYKGRKPSGSCILEARGYEGKVSCFAQDLKPETMYTVYLLFKDGERYAGMPCGVLPVDKAGKAQQRFAFDADKILGGAFTLDECVGIIVLAGKIADLSAPLCGYLSSAVSWRRNFYDGSLRGRERPEPPAQYNAPPSAAEPAQPRIRASFTPKGAAPDEEFKRTALAFKEELSKMKQEAPPNPNLVERLTPIFNKYKAVTPFKRQNRAAKWVNVAPDEKLPTPLNAPRIFDEPFVREACDRDGHILVGVTEGPGRRQYIIGVPELYDPAVRVKANLLGFSQFKPCEDMRLTKGMKGYWLMFVNM